MGIYFPNVNQGRDGAEGSKRKVRRGELSSELVVTGLKAINWLSL